MHLKSRDLLRGLVNFSKGVQEGVDVRYLLLGARLFCSGDDNVGCVGITGCLGENFS